jgi:hypothetical protein
MSAMHVRASRDVRRFTAIPMLIGMLLAFPGPATATDITACGTTVAAGDTGVLQADLDCSTFPIGVLLLSNAVLDLNGHSIAGGDATMATVQGAQNADGTGKAHLRIVGPGEISGTSQNYNVPSGTQTCVQANDGHVTIGGGTGTVDIHGCIYGIKGSTGVDPNGRARVSLDHVHLHDLLWDGAAVGALVASNVDVGDNGGQGLGAAKLVKAQNVVAHNNAHGHGVFAGTSLKGVNIESTGNYSGVEAWKTLKLDGAQVTGNTFSGVAGLHVKVLNATITGNGVVDVLSATRPFLQNTTCDKSLDFNSMSWHVCANGSPSGAFLDDVSAGL